MQQQSIQIDKQRQESDSRFSHDDHSLLPWTVKTSPSRVSKVRCESRKRKSVAKLGAEEWASTALTWRNRRPRVCMSIRHETLVKVRRALTTLQRNKAKVY